MSSPRTPRLAGLELLRGLAALAVCVGHVRALLLPSFWRADYAWWETPLYFLTSHGDAAVWIFFVLSGYLVGGAVWRQRVAGTWNWPDYLLRRGVRLWVVLIPALALTFLCDASRGPARPVSGGILTDLTDPSRSAVGVWFGNMFFLQDIRCAPYGTNTSLWSLAYEFWYYLLFPLAVALGHARTPKERLMLAVPVAGIVALIGPRGWWLALPWLAGVAVAVLEGRAVSPDRPFARRWPWLALGLVLTIQVYLPADARSRGMPLVALVTAILIWSEAARTGPLPWLGVRLGVTSFTLYAIHLPLAVVATTALAGPYALAVGPMRWVAVFATTLGLVVFAQGWWWLFESRTDRLRSALAARLDLPR
jgi:peptidoglycan/LPS O-acetylase OafA/YrhL